MTKNTAKTGPLPNASIDFDKVQANAKSGEEDVFKKALSKERETDPEKIAKAEAATLERRAKLQEEAAAAAAKSGAGVDATGTAPVVEGDRK